MPENTDEDEQNSNASHDSVDLDEIVNEDTRERVARSLDTHSPMMPLLIPPVPLHDVPYAVGDEDEYTGRLFALADLARAFNKAGDPTMAQDDEWDEEAEEWVELDEPQYPITAESVDEVKLAVALIYEAYHRDLEALSEELGVADDPEYEKERHGEEYYDHKAAIKDYFGYEAGRHDYEKPVRDIADKLGVEPEDVADSLRDDFGDDVDLFDISDPMEFVGLDEVEDALDLGDEDDEE